MSLDEAFFGWFHRKLTGWRARPSSEIIERTVDTSAMLSRLRVVASAAAERNVRVNLVDDDGGVAGDAILLPARVSTLATREDNERLLIVRATLAGAIVRAELEPGVSAVDAEYVLEHALPSIEAALRIELPGWGELRDRLPPDLPAEALTGRLRGRIARSLDIAADDAGETDELPRPTTEREARRRPPPTRQRRLTEEDKETENPLTHSFEKVHTAEEHKGGSKSVDGSDQLDDQLAALDELDLTEVVLSRERTRSVYKSDLVFEAGAESATGGIGALRYDEWDAHARRYLPRHCAVTVEDVRGSAAEGAALRARILRDERRSVVETRAALLRVDAALRWHTRQTDGPDVDLDALVDRAASLRAGHDGSTRLYASRRRRGRSLAALLLVDGSLSTDAWVDNRRVLDVERDAAAIVGLAFDGLVDELAMAAFCSFSHEDCRFTPLKELREPLGRGLERLAVVEPRGYTRVGPALRHGTRVLEASRANRRVILLFSDGKPTDTDRYEGRHGIGDVRQAVREAKQRGVDVFALSADPRSRPLLPQMFGAHCHASLAAPRDGARAVGALCTRILR